MAALLHTHLSASRCLAAFTFTAGFSLTTNAEVVVSTSSKTQAVAVRVDGSRQRRRALLEGVQWLAFHFASLAVSIPLSHFCGGRSGRGNPSYEVRGMRRNLCGGTSFRNLKPRGNAGQPNFAACTNPRVCGVWSCDMCVDGTRSCLADMNFAP